MTVDITPLDNGLPRIDKSSSSSSHRRAITPSAIIKEAEMLLQEFEPCPHSEILSKLLGLMQHIDFRDKAGLSDDDDKLCRKHYLVYAIAEILTLSKANKWGFCRKNGIAYLYNGAFWNRIDEETLKVFLGEAAAKLGVIEVDAQLHRFRDDLIKQFFSAAPILKPKQSKKAILINLKNGTLKITSKGVSLKVPDPDDFLTTQLPFRCDRSAECPRFVNFLEEVLPDAAVRRVIAEYSGYILTPNKVVNAEKVLLLFGTGANGKSVFFEILMALLGRENVCSFSLQNLTKHESYQRAELEYKLLNYSSEISGKLDSAIFKQLASGEPVEARRIYCEPFTMYDYAKLIFNCNTLPTDVELSHAYFRRFIIVRFPVTISRAQQDPQLAKKIIETELSGIFNWMLDGLLRLMQQQAFSDCDAIEQEVDQYRRQSDTVQLFLDESCYQKATELRIPLKDLYVDYKVYCFECSYHPVGKLKFSERLRNCGITVERDNQGMNVYVEKVFPAPAQTTQSTPCTGLF